MSSNCSTVNLRIRYEAAMMNNKMMKGRFLLKVAGLKKVMIRRIPGSMMPSSFERIARTNRIALRSASFDKMCFTFRYARIEPKKKQV
jgi:hypothetical protein